MSYISSISGWDIGDCIYILIFHCNSTIHSFSGKNSNAVFAYNCYVKPFTVLFVR